MNANKRKLPRIKENAFLGKRGGEFVAVPKTKKHRHSYEGVNPVTFKSQQILDTLNFQSKKGVANVLKVIKFCKEDDKKTFRSVTMLQFHIKILAAIRVYLRSFAFSFYFSFSFKFHSNA